MRDLTEEEREDLVALAKSDLRSAKYAKALLEIDLGKRLDFGSALEKKTVKDPIRWD